MSSKGKEPSRLERVEDALLQYYAYKFDDVDTPEDAIKVFNMDADGSAVWRVGFEIRTESEYVSGSVFQAQNGQHYIDDDRNSNGTSVYQNIDGYF